MLFFSKFEAVFVNSGVCVHCWHEFEGYNISDKKASDLVCKVTITQKIKLNLHVWLCQEKATISLCVK